MIEKIIRDGIRGAVSRLDEWDVDDCEDVIGCPTLFRGDMEIYCGVVREDTFWGMSVITEKIGNNYHTTVIVPNRNSFRMVGHRVSSDVEEAGRVHYGAIGYIEGKIRAGCSVN